MDIIVTGAAGGIGAVLCDSLIGHGHEVWAIDDLSSGSPRNLSQDSPRLHLVPQSVTSRTLADAGPWERANAVIHLAAISSLPQCQIDPLKAFDVNLLGTLRVAELAKTSDRLKIFVNASTSAIYEGVTDMPYREDHVVHPHLVYPQSKWYAEHALESARKDTGFPAVSFRFFNVFGPMQDYARKSPPLLNYIVREAVAGRHPVLHSDGYQSRDYISVHDVVRAIELALDHDFRGESVFNLCSGVRFSVRDFVAICEDALGVNLDPVYRSSEKLWDGYPDLFTGRFPLDPAVVAHETEKESLGSSERYRRETGWSYNLAIRDDIASVMREAAEHIRATMQEQRDRPA